MKNHKQGTWRKKHYPGTLKNIVITYIQFFFSDRFLYEKSVKITPKFAVSFMHPNSQKFSCKI